MQFTRDPNKYNNMLIKQSRRSYKFMTDTPTPDNAPETTEPAAASNRTLYSKPYTHYVLGVLMVVYIFNFVDRQILAILAQSIKVDLNLSDTQIGALSGIAFGIFYATLGIPIARLADKYSRVNIITASLG
ncbi:MAG: sugar phosphate permease, partial [Candidatus Azotimanducaceae bacterium]